jgi:hypothetical protein
MSKRLREWWLSRAARMETPVAPDPPAPDPELIEKFAKQAHDLDALRKTVEDAAAVSAGFWLSYLFVLFYIAIAAGAVTHKDLLLENSVKLAFLGVDLPLVAFFVLAPILFIVSHAYTLVHFVMLGAKVGVYDTELRAQLGDARETRDGLRRQLPSNIFVQFLAGPADVRKGGLGLILKAIAWVSLVIGPVLLLLLIQAQFSPYHLEWVTWVQRIAIVVDVILLWLLWPAVLNGRSKLMWRLERRGTGWPGVLASIGRYIARLAACLIPIGLAFTAATFPGEWLDEHVGNKQWIRPNGVTAWLGAKDQQDKPISTSFHDLLFDGKVEDVTRRRRSLFSNTLVLPHFDALEAAKFDDPKKLESVKQTLVLRGRHLERAVFDSADLRKADLGGAQLQGASLDGVRLEGASLFRARLQGASLLLAQLQGASLFEAQLQGALLYEAPLQGASLEGARLQGADFRKSTFAGTNMRNAAVWRTSFENASLTAVLEDGVKESALTKEELATLKAMITEVPEGGYVNKALKRIEILNPNIFGPEASEQATLEKGRGDKPTYRNALADQLESLACSGDADAVYIVHNIGGRELFAFLSIIREMGAQAPGLVNAILDLKCPVSAALTDKAALKEIAKAASRAP